VSPQNVVRMSGIKFERVTLDARQTAPTDPKHTLTYQWTLEKQPKRIAGDPLVGLTNDRGSIASFVPDLKGTYEITLEVSDGCNEPQKSQTLVVTVDCDASTIDAQPSTVMVGLPNALREAKTGCSTEADNSRDGYCNEQDEAVIRWRSSVNAQDEFESYQFLLKGKSGTTCTVKRRQWFLVNRQCTPPYKPKAAPKVEAAQASCKVDYTCRWALHKIPCMKKSKDYRKQEFNWIKQEDSRNPPKNTVLAADGESDLPLSNKKVLVPCAVGSETPTSRCLLESVTSRNTQCVTNFQCRAPGTYQLSLTVGDGCSEKREFMCVTCRCQTKLAVDAGVAQASLYTCNAGGVNEFASVKLEGKVTPLEERGGLKLEECQREASAPTPQANPAQTCCPTQPECPKCPNCPSCPDKCTPVPSCPTSGRGSAKTRPSPTARSQRRRAFHAGDEKDSSKSDNFSFAHVMGVTIPLSSVMILTLLGNVILHRKIRSCEAELQ